ncbi:A/G-specific adenine glycosylase [Actinomyces sp. zg296]|uniref:A/G-specific adenine glycosylase n=1 Tax=Actinomyces sp. zg296 TaxID=2609289 RepID=UPI001F1763C5|nr:A/G-specific adenine glycosylase [Actinomyces sp. zg296]
MDGARGSGTLSRGIAQAPDGAGSPMGSADSAGSTGSTGSTGSAGCPGGVTGGEDAASEIIAWYRHHARDLPWRRPGTSPWAILVSEVMSQQTPVARVIPAWQEWQRRWPGPAELAAAPTADVLRVWGRLGYPRRALRLKECADAVVAEHDGALPAQRDLLLALPGVGEYTAGAVMAFAYGRRALALDTNVRRVLARSAGGEALPAPHLGRAERDRAERLLPHDDATAAQWSVAVMELGALVCVAREPDCGACPWSQRCAWLAAGRPGDAHAGRRRTQAWAGTDRQARGLVMAVLREAPEGRGVVAEVLLAAAARAARRGSADAGQPGRALAGLLADGLIATDDAGASYRLP